MQVPIQFQAETTTKPAHPVSESQPVLSEVEEPAPGHRGQTSLPKSEEDPAAPQEVSMARSAPSHNGSGVFAAIQELTAEFVLDDESQPKWGDGRVIDEPLLPSPGSISGASRNPVPRGARLPRLQSPPWV
jgi:cyclophilin family peptidyl-prolyl cis-trans isomerase